ncbi:MAG: EamA family transporter [Nitrospiraceae bacterium]|nr:MAG: EamA family transporter [Nitrospiraceae bacterium]
MGHFKIITAILIWSSLGIFIRKVDLPNVGILFHSCLIAGILQFIIISTTGLLKNEIQGKNNKRDALFLVLVPISFIANSLFFYYAFRNTTIANAVLTHYTAPVFVAFMAPFFLKENIRKTTWAAIVISSAGLWFILQGADSETAIPLSSSEKMGIIAGALSGLAYAFLIVLIRRIASCYSSLFITFIQNGIVALLLLPFILHLKITMQVLPYLIIMGVVHSTLAPLLYVQGFRSVKANEAAILGYCEPVGATVLAFLFFREVPGLTALLGGAMILLSGYLILRVKQ